MDLEKKLASLNELSKSLLSKILTITTDSKYLILEPAVIKPLEKICGVKWLRSKGIEKIFKLEETPPQFDNLKSIFYMIYSNFNTFKQVITQIRAVVDIDNPPLNKFHIIVIPQSVHLFETELEEYGLLNSVVKLHCFQWLPIHIDTGILSLEFPFSFNSLYIKQSLTYLPMFSKCLWQLMLVLGKVNFVISLGQFSNAILSQFDTLCEEKGCGDKSDYCEVGGLIILDRNLDYVSPFLTPGIYSALLKETYEVNAGHCESKIKENSREVDSKFNPIKRKDPVIINMDSESDIVFAKTKNKYFTEVTSVLGNLTKELKTEKVNSKDMSIDEMKKYVQTQLGATSSRKKIICNHLIAAETIISHLGWRFENLCETESKILNNSSKSSNLNFLNEITYIENDPLISLRLFCLMLITQRLSDGEISSFWEKFLHQFGFKYNYALQNLLNAGILPSSDTKSVNSTNKYVNIKLPIFNSNQFHLNANRLKQIPANKDKIDYKYPTCPSYVFRGAYIPLITQIASMVLNSTSLEEIKSKLEGVGSLIVRNERAYPLQRRTLLVYIVGGVTYAEIGALNFIEDLTGAKVIILSDRIVSGNDLVGDFLTLPK